MNNLGLLIPHWLHLLAAMAWVGGILYINFVLLPALAPQSTSVKAPLMPLLLRRFITVVWSAAGLLLLTGLDRAMRVQHLVSAAAWFETPYGRLLAIKLFFFLLLVGIAGHVTFVTYPRVRAHMPSHCNTAPGVTTECAECRALTGALRRMMRIALLVALAVVLLAAALRMG
ncbi:MAG: CopD family protein [Deltaproteobacteria bacterium]|nr:CopD family protein [Deltaproteobacteria bacterium]